MPAGNASRESWISYAIGQGMPREEAASLTRDQIKARFAAPAFDPDAPPADLDDKYFLNEASRSRPCPSPRAVGISPPHRRVGPDAGTGPVGDAVRVRDVFIGTAIATGVDDRCHRGIHAARQCAVPFTLPDFEGAQAVTLYAITSSTRRLSIAVTGYP